MLSWVEGGSSDVMHRGLKMDNLTCNPFMFHNCTSHLSATVTNTKERDRDRDRKTERDRDRETG